MTDREAPRRQRRSYGGLSPDTWPRQAVASSPASPEMHSIRVPGTMHVPAPTSSAAVRGGHTDPERRGRGRQVEGHGTWRWRAQAGPFSGSHLPVTREPSRGWVTCLSSVPLGCKTGVTIKYTAEGGHEG